MCTAVPRTDEDTKTLSAAFELGEPERKLAMPPDLQARPRLRALRPRSTRCVLQILEKERLQGGAG